MSAVSILYGAENLPLKIGVIELSCFILTDQRIAFSKNGLQRALGYDGKSEDWLLDLLSSINKFYPIPGALFEAYENPILFEIARPDGSIVTAWGISPQDLLLTCHTIQNARNDGYLNVGQLKHAKAATAIIDYFDANELSEAVAQATGLNFVKESGKTYLQEYLLSSIDDAAYRWVESLRDAFFEKIFELHDMSWKDLRNQPRNVALILQEVVFSRLTDHVTDALRNSKPKRAYKRKGYNAQNNEHPELSVYITEVLSLLKAAADNWTIFIQLLNRIYPKNQPVELNLPDLKPVAQVSGLLNVNLKKAVELNKIYHKK